MSDPNPGAEPPSPSPSPSPAAVPATPATPATPTTPAKPSDIGLLDEPELPSSSSSSSQAPQPPLSGAEASEAQQEEETTPTASYPDPLAPSPSPSAPEVDLSEDPVGPPVAHGGGLVRAAFRSASWKSVQPEFTAPLPFQSMIIVEEFDVEGAQWSGKAWQMVTTTAKDPTSWYYAGELVFQGSIGGRKGKAIFRSMGSVSTADGLDGTLTLIPETASDELAGLHATAKCREKEVAPHLPIRYTLTLS